MIRLYTTPTCSFCFAAKRLLVMRGLEYAEINVAADSDAMAEMMHLTGNRSVPQVIIHDQPIGGFAELAELDRTGELLPLLEGR